MFESVVAWLYGGFIVVLMVSMAIGLGTWILGGIGRAMRGEKVSSLADDLRRFLDGR